MGAVAVAAVVIGIVLAVSGGSSHKHGRAGSRAELSGGGSGASSGRSRSGGGVEGGAATGGSVAGEPAGDFGAASAYVGVNKAKLRKELASGRSLAAVAATTPGHSALGLLEAIMRPRVRRIEAQVASKKLSKAIAQRRIQRIRKRVQARLARSATYKPTVAIAGLYLGLSPTELRAKLHGGRTLAQLADSTPGKSAKGLIAAVMTVRISELVHGVDETSEATLRRETALLRALEARVSMEVQRAEPAVLVAPSG
jgi:hypothetical protein